jgi:hypothetical protein
MTLKQAYFLDKLTEILSVEDDFVVFSSHYQFYFGGAKKRNMENSDEYKKNIMSFIFPDDVHHGNLNFLIYGIMKQPLSTEYTHGGKYIPIVAQNTYLIKNIFDKKQLIRANWTFNDTSSYNSQYKRCFALSINQTSLLKWNFHDVAIDRN